MNSRCLLLAFVCLVVVAAACVAPRSNLKAAPDGIHVLVEASDADHFVMVTDLTGTLRRVGIRKYKSFILDKATSFSLLPAEEGYQVQLAGATTDSRWAEAPIVIVVDSKPYIEVSKTGDTAWSAEGPISIPTMVSFKVANYREAQKVTEALLIALKPMR